MHLHFQLTLHIYRPSIIYYLCYLYQFVCHFRLIGFLCLPPFLYPSLGARACARAATSGRANIPPRPRPAVSPISPCTRRSPRRSRSSPCWINNNNNNNNAPRASAELTVAHESRAPVAFFGRSSPWLTSLRRAYRIE